MSIYPAGNAIKFTEKGEVVVYASVENRNEDSVELKFGVKDTGNTSLAYLYENKHWCIFHYLLL